MECIRTILIKNYPREIQLSKARRAKYFKPGDKMPVKYLSDIQAHEKNFYGLDKNGNKRVLAYGFMWKEEKKKWRLYNIETKEYVIKNSRSIGTPKVKTIAGNDIYRYGMQSFTISNMIGKLHNYFMNELTKLNIEPITTYPVFIHYDFECIMNDEKDDVDNYGLPYYKSFQDCLVKSGILVNDTRKYVTGFKITSKPIREDTSVFEQQVDKLTVKIYANSLQETAV